MIDAEAVESAVKYLAESAQEYANAKGRRVWLEERRKIVKATEASASALSTVAARDDAAYCSDAYKAVVDDLRDAVVAEETMRAYRSAAEARIEVFRTMEASKRAANV